MKKSDVATERKASTETHISMNPQKVSFGLKTVEKKPLRTSSNPLGDDSAGNDLDSEARRHSIVHFDGSKLPKDGASTMERASDMVIPLVKEMDWRVERLLKLKSEGKLSEEDNAKLQLLTEAQDLYVKNENGAADGSVAKGSEEDADYDSVPVEAFGLAVLRGCGWKDGEGIGKTNKRVVPLQLPKPRLKCLGLGAVAPEKWPSSGGKADEESAEKSQSLKISSLVKVTNGLYRNSYGKVESFDADNGSVIVKLAVGHKNVRVNEYSLVLVSEKEYERQAKCINAKEYDRELSKIEKRNKGQHEGSKSEKEKRTSSGLEMEDGKASSAKSDEREVKLKRKQTEKVSILSTKRPKSDKMWVRPDLRVRFVDKKFEDGRLYDDKFRVVDAPDQWNCAIKDYWGKVYYHVHEDWLETVIPREKRSPIWIVGGRHRGQPAILESRDKQKELVYARLVASDEIVAVSFDQACQFDGDIEDYF